MKKHSLLGCFFFFLQQEKKYLEFGLGVLACFDVLECCKMGRFAGMFKIISDWYCFGIDQAFRALENGSMFLNSCEWVGYVAPE